MASYRQLFSYIFKFVKQQKWMFLLIYTLDAFAWPLDVLIWPIILRKVTEIFTQFDGQRELVWGSLLYPVIGAICLSLYIEISSRFMGYLSSRATPRLLSAIRMDMFKHVSRHSPKYFNERFGGALANKISDMTNQVEFIMTQMFFPIVPAISSTFLGAIILGFVHPIFSVILLSWVAVHISVCLLFTKSVSHHSHTHSQDRTHLLGRIVDSFTNNFSVNLFYRFGYEQEFIQKLADKETKSNQKSKGYIQKMLCVLSGLYLVFVVFVMFGLLVYLWIQNWVSTGEMIQVFATVWAFAMIMFNIGRTLPLLFQSIGAARQAYTVMEDECDLGDRKDASDLKVSSGAIKFEDVSFSYGKSDLFEGLNLSIKGGEKVGLVGFTGAGKSTFVNLLLRLFSVKKGKISIDGMDISQVSLKSLRKGIAMIPQDPVLFHRTLAENIAYGKMNASKEDVLAASKLAHSHYFIKNLHDGYDSKVGERGTKLSGGEKQRIAIARALLADAPILILDEATSALDSVTEEMIQTSFDQFMKDRTAIVIAHRLSTLSHLDRIIVFDAGKIVEEGSHEDLLAQEGYYAKMWKKQVGGFLPQTPN